MKRYLLPLLALVGLALALSACGTSGHAQASGTWNSSGSATSAPAPSQATPTQPPSTQASSPIAGSPASQNNQASREGLTIQVIGNCATNNNQGMTLAASGFTHNGDYMTQAWYPSGQQYTYLLNGGKGTADANGHLPNWTWNCYTSPTVSDPAGTYTLQVTDLTTGNWVRTTFTVSYPNN